MNIEAARPSQIAYLLPEILSQAFIHCVPDAYEVLTKDLWWIQVSHVNRHWRQVALSCPQLWTSIIFSRPMWIPVMLARAKNAPLVIRTDLNRDAVDVVEHLVQNHVSNICILDIRGSARKLEQFFYSLPESCRMLESLTVLNSSYLDQPWIPETFLSESGSQSPYSRLRYAEFHACAVAWSSSLYTTLTHLKLVRTGALQGPSMLSFMSALRVMPNLQSITLIETTLNPDDSFSIYLPRLTSITIEGPAQDCTKLLSNIWFPTSVVMNMSGTFPADTYWEDRSISIQSMMWGAAKRCRREPIYTMAQLVRIWCGLAFRLFDPRRKQLDFEVRMDTWDITDVRICIRSMIWYFPLKNITDLELTGHLSWNTSRPIEAYEWQELWKDLSRLNYVRCLTLSNDPLPLLMSTLFRRAMQCIGVGMAPSTEHIGPDGKGKQLLPALEVIHLRNIDCGSFTQSRPSFMDLMFGFLWARRRGHARVNTIRLTYCRRVNELDLSRLRYLVDVSWDGIGQDSAMKDDCGLDPPSLAMHIFGWFADTAGHLFAPSCRREMSNDLDKDVYDEAGESPILMILDE